MGESAKKTFFLIEASLEVFLVPIPKQNSVLIFAFNKLFENVRCNSLPFFFFSF